jgi:ubiquinone/menaquinone biosynthesis C-methylase UbiE
MRSHDQAIRDQFDSKAQAYLSSAVHAQGADLAYASGLASGDAALDVGCGAGHLSFALATGFNRVIALDPSPGMREVVVQAARARGLAQIETCEGSAESLPFEDRAFDLVGTRFSAHHWRNLASGLREMRRVLRPGACLLAIDTLGHEDALVDTHLQSIELLRDPSHVRNRSASQWRGLLEAAGFSDVRLTQWSLRLDFASWVERMRAPASHVAVIRELQLGAAREIHEALSLEADGSFSLQVGAFEAR